MKILLDTCIVIDVLQKREKFFDDAYALFIANAYRKYEGHITAKSVTDIYYLMHKHFGNHDETKKAIEILFKLFHVLDTDGIDCKKALLSQMSDYEDAIMDETALREGMDGIVTRNLNDYKNAKSRVYHPKDFLLLLKKANE